MFGRGKKDKKGPGELSFGLDDLIGPAGQVPLAPDGQVPPLIPPGQGDPQALLTQFASHQPELRQASEGNVALWCVPAEPGYETLQVWRRIRQLFSQTGWWPLLVGGDFWDRIGYELPDPYADAGDGRSWILSALADDSESDDGSGLAGQIPRRLGALPRDVGALGWDDVLTVMEVEVTELCLVPVGAPWQVPAALNWDGAVNRDLMADGHTSLLRRWSAAFGAEPVGLTGDVISLRVDRPPTDRPAALLAAVEVVSYCPDAVFQGTETLEALADVLAAPSWSLWWD